MKLAALILALFCGSVQAAPSCVPMVYGNQVGDAFGKRTNEGRYLHWYCKVGDKIVPEGLAGGGAVAYRLAGKGQMLAAARAVILGGPGPWRPPQ